MFRKYYLFLLLPLIFFSGCDSGGSSKKIFMNGLILNAAQLGEIIVRIIEDDRTRDSTDVNPDGSFELNFNSSTGSVTLQFETDSFTAERQNFSVTDDSEIDLDVTIQQNPILIVINSWVVFQDRISLKGDDFINFNESQAELVLNGDGKTCMKTTGESIIDFRVMNIDISNCSQALRTEGSSQIILRADEDISILSEESSIRSKNESFVGIGQTLTPINNNVEVRSFEKNGIEASGAAEVVFTPQNNCTIQGADNAVSTQPGTTVDTAGCTLVDG